VPKIKRVSYLSIKRELREKKVCIPVFRLESGKEIKDINISLGDARQLLVLVANELRNMKWVGFSRNPKPPLYVVRELFNEELDALKTDLGEITSE